MKQNMDDPLLAITTCRMLLLQKPDNEELKTILNKTYDDFFIQRGIDHGDSYLTSIGLWGQQKYVEAVNALQERDSDDMVKKSGISHMF